MKKTNLSQSRVCCSLETLYMIKAFFKIKNIYKYFYKQVSVTVFEYFKTVSFTMLVPVYNPISV